MFEVVSRIESPPFSQEAIIPLDLLDGCSTIYCILIMMITETPGSGVRAQDGILISLCTLFNVKLGEKRTRNLHGLACMCSASCFHAGPPGTGGFYRDPVFFLPKNN